MSTSILAPTSLPSAGILYTAAQTFTLDTVVQAQSTNAGASSLMSPAVVTLLLSSDGINYVPIDAKRFSMTNPGTSFQVFTLSEYFKSISATSSISSGVPTPKGAAPTTFTPPWTNYMLQFTGNIGAAVAVSAIGDSVGLVPAVTLSAAMDAAFGSQRGNLIYRGASGWAGLGPGIGQVVTSGGPGADPSWGNTTGSTFLYQGSNYPMIDNVNTATTLLSTPSGSAGSLTIPANTIAESSSLLIYFSGIYSTTGTPTMKFSLLLGSTVISTTGLIATSTASFMMFGGGPILVNFDGIGAACTVQTFGLIYAATSGLLTNQGVLSGNGAGSFFTGSVDTTANLTIDFQLTFSAASTSNLAAIKGFTVVKIG